MNNDELKKKLVEIIINAIWKDAQADYDSTDESEARTIADAFIAAGIGDVKEAEHRAEVAEKERNECERKTEIAQKAGKIIRRDMLRVFGSENSVINDKINALWDLALQQAEREIEENALRQTLLTVEEEERKDVE